MKNLYLLPLIAALAACAKGAILEPRSIERPPLVIPPASESQATEEAVMVEVKVEEPKIEAVKPEIESPKPEAVVENELETSSPQATAESESPKNETAAIEPKSLKPETTVEKKAVEKRAVTADIKKPRINYVPYDVGSHKAATPQQIYTVLASRIINRMLKETSSIYADAKFPQLYVADTRKEGDNPLPDNYQYTAAVAKDIITGSHSYLLVDSQKDADYVLNIYVSSNRIPSRETDIITCRMIMQDRDNKEIGSWFETLSPITNDDKSWW